jgi:hypothetical protein
MTSSNAIDDLLWVCAQLYLDDMLDKQISLIDGIPGVITRLQYLLNMEVRKRAHQVADENWKKEADEVLAALKGASK